MSLRAAGVLDPQRWVPLNLVKKEGGLFRYPFDHPFVYLTASLLVSYIPVIEHFITFLLPLCAREKLFLEI